MEKVKQLEKTFNKEVIKLLAIYLLIMIPALLLFDGFVTHIIIFDDPTTHSYKMQRLITNENKQEIPLLGSSKVFSGYLPEVMGEQFYNYGMPAASFGVVNLLLQYELEKPKKTPIIIDIATGSINHNPYTNIKLRDYIPLLKYPLVSEFIKSNGRNRLYYHIFGIRYYGAYFGYFKHYMESFSHRKKMFNRGGVFHITPSPEELKRAIEKQQRINWKRVFRFNKKIAITFEKLLIEYPERQFVLVESPFHKSFYQTEKEGEVLEVEQYWEKMNRLANVTLIKISGEDYPEAYFRDTVHLSLNGAKHFSIKLKEILVEKELIPQ